MLRLRKAVIRQQEKGMRFLKGMQAGLLATAVAGGIGLGAPGAQAQEVIKVGILHSLSGTMAISETTRDVMLMLIDEQNRKGGCSASGSNRLWSIRRRTGHCSPKRRAN
jgi:hypothetical protein